MLVPARGWSADALPVRLESTNLKGSTGHDGKANFWRAQFASAGRQKSEPFTWSGVATEDTPKGVNHGVEDTYNPANRLSRPFDLNFLKVDTDKAFEVAQEHGGKKLLEKDPKTNVGYLLDFDAQVKPAALARDLRQRFHWQAYGAGGREFRGFSAERIELLPKLIYQYYLPKTQSICEIAFLAFFANFPLGWASRYFL